MNDAQRWQRIEELCHDALARQPEERAGFLDQACAGDTDLRREVESLVAQQSSADRFLEGSTPLGRVSSLAAGSRLGPYEIAARIGAGGMGEVYRARDTRLGRTVAIKVLPAEVAADPERRRRFEHEARAVSALNHPNICTLHDIGSDRGVDYLVMELVEGQTLAERLLKGPLPLVEALEYGAQIGDALGKAHRQGIVHRDLKPANIMLTKSGIKLLDFGLAKLRSRATGVTARPPALPTEEPTTTPGLVLGTVPYMAPEQLEGKQTDARTDIFAFGCVLYEMLTGRRAFAGESEASVISQIMSTQPPPLSSLQPVVPPLLDHIVGRCLEKEPDERWQSAADITPGLRWILTQHRAADAPAPGGRQPVSRVTRIRHAVARGVLAAGLVVAGGVVMWLVTRSTTLPELPVVRSLIDTAPADGLRTAEKAEQTIGRNRPAVTAIALSPDGAWVVFSAVQGERQMLYRRKLSEDAAVPFEGTEGADTPFFSPDGRWVGFWARQTLWKIRLGGGIPTELCPAPFGIAGASWSSRDVIAFASTQLYEVPAAGGAAKVRLAPDVAHGEKALRFPHYLPDGRDLLLTVVRDVDDLRTASVVAVSLANGTRTPVVEGAVDARYLPTGHLVYARLGTLEASSFDANRLAVTGPAVALLSDVMQAANAGSILLDTGAPQFSVSATGMLAYVTGGILRDQQNSLVWLDRRGSVIETLPVPPGPHFQPKISPDGQRVLFMTSGLKPSLWMYDIARRTSTLLTALGHPYAPIWTHDGQRAVFCGSVGAFNGMWSVPVDGRVAPTAFEGEVPPTAIEAPGSWTPDGSALVYTRMDEEGPTIWLLRTVNGVPARSELLPPPGKHIAPVPILYNLPALSPDGHWLAYAGTESGKWQVYVERFPELGDRRQLSSDPDMARSPVWRRDGRELFFVAEGTSRRMMAIDVRPDGQLVGEPRVLFQIPPDLHTSVGSVAPYDVSGDGRRFIFVRRESATIPPPPSRIHLVSNWLEEVKAKVPAGR